ncbi:MAG: serine/threonine-protein phosphatase [Ignavibacteriales bacterium]|nr:serine/threonine-protein phosphatase [Ignavibacteriales bacterium]
MTSQNQTNATEPGIGKTVINDIRSGGFFDNILNEYRELKEFMLTTERKDQLQKMGRVKRWFFITWWLLKSMFFKLTPTRRILLLLALIFLIQNSQTAADNRSYIIGGIILIFIIMLELKDKLTAKEELEAGHAIQKALMPDRSPKVRGWDLWLFTRSANEVGGDLLDFQKVTDDRFGFALGDVAGKGLKAALLSAKLQATLRALVVDYSSLRELGVKLNQLFYRDRVPSIFASIVYAEIKPGDGLIRLINAGQFQPIIVRGNSIEKMEKGGAALGIVPDAQYDEQNTILDAGDLMLFYSDGLSEARNQMGEDYGEKRLVSLLPLISQYSADKIGERIISEVDRFVGKAKAHDDLSMIVVKREKS